MRILVLVFFLTVLGCKTDKKYHDAPEEKVVVVETDALQAILDHQEKLNKEFKDPETSPLPDRYRKNFEVLDFFAPDTNYVVTAKFVRTPEALPFLMPSTTGDSSEETVYGIAHFTLNGKNRQLEVYQNKELMQQEKFRDYLFLPFTDDTNGVETYTGGRYIDLSIPDGDTIVIDFNKAYNPYCAYNKKFSCPVVPSVNNLDTEILAGVKAFDPTKK
ncbi:DUF1684 domain-containing protein [Zobellia barbeyronii]|uniref:DUF1684 domain-containing protein n=1 Tax=Zobellia barbeyronii TaxID=2748009 RepID=A0ABS5WFI4_9FLAO|nr:DUF1684 domain-containing protein [Zobellia barbeyronii]MBT2162154.1 DUF1684 domain-containing protein [Zobellia barbeyronii]